MNATAVNVTLPHPLWAWLAEYRPSPSAWDALAANGATVAINCSAQPGVGVGGGGGALGSWPSFPLPQTFGAPPAPGAAGGLEQDDFYAAGADPYGSAYNAAGSDPQPGYHADGPPSLFFADGVAHADGPASPGWADARALFGCASPGGYSYSRTYPGVRLYTRDGAGLAIAAQHTTRRRSCNIGHTVRQQADRFARVHADGRRWPASSGSGAYR